MSQGFYALKSLNHSIVENCELAIKAYHVNIISIKETCISRKAFPDKDYSF